MKLALNLSGACAALALVAAPASAQLIVGTTTTATTNGCAFYYDVTAATTTTLWNSVAQKKVNGLAADLASGRLYSNDAARLNFWNYGSQPTAPTPITGMYRTNDNITFTATGVNDLAFANGNLYGATSFASATFSRGIYRISTVSDGASPTSHAVMTPQWTTTNGSTVLSGLEYRADTGLFYATSTADTTSTGGQFVLGLYSIDALGSGAVNKIADLPFLPSTTTTALCDGLAYGNGKFWLTRQEPAQNRIDIFPFDPATGLYGTTIFIPLTDATQRASGAAWAPGALNPVPAPGAATLVGIGGLLAARRRRTA